MAHTPDLTSEPAKECLCLETERLTLRRVEETDFPFLLSMGQDQKVMEFLGPLQTEEEIHTFIKKISEHEKAYGFSYLAIDEKLTGKFVGLVGLLVPSFEAPFTPCVEIGWRLCYEAWGKGYAFEAAYKLMAWGFEEKNLKEIVAFTAVINKRSEKIMLRLGMTNETRDNFRHPKLKKEDPLSEHILYRKSSTQK